MSGFDYGNARLRAMKARLLTQGEINHLVESSTIQGLLSALINTSYRKSMEVSLARKTGVNCIHEGIRLDFVNTVGKLNGFYHGQAAEMVNLVLRRYDLQNLKAILRGLDKHISAGEIMAIILPVGELKESVLTSLASAATPRTVIDRLASMRYPFAQPLLELRAEKPGVDISIMEIALEHWFYKEAFANLLEMGRKGNVLRTAFEQKVDITNLMISLRFSQSPDERNLVHEWIPGWAMDRLYVQGGTIPDSLLIKAGSADRVEIAVEVLGSSAYQRQLKSGLEAYHQTGLLSEFERKLNQFHTTWLVRQIISDPLGIGVVLGYLAYKSNEVNNLRWITESIQIGMMTDQIRAGVEYPT